MVLSVSCFNFHSLIRSLIMLVMIFSLFGSGISDARPLIRKIGNKYWIPNTTIKLEPQASAVFLHEQTLYFALTGGLGEYDLQNESFLVHYLGNDELGSNITSIASVDEDLWVATRRGIRIFNTREKRFTQSLTPLNSPLGSDSNLTLNLDKEKDLLYICGFESIQRYEIKKKRWEDLNFLYRDLNMGEPTSNPLCLLNDSNVWLASSAHAASKGGLLRFEKKDMVWSLIRDQLTSQKNPKRIDIADMLISNRYLFVLVNDKVARFDNNQNKWDLFNSGEMTEVGQQISGLLPEISGHYSKNSDCLLGRLIKYFNDEIKFQNFKEIYFNGKQVIGLNPDSFSVYEEKKYNQIIRYTNEPLIIKKPMGCDGVSKALFLTNRGLDLLDINTMDFLTIKESDYFKNKNEFYDYKSIWDKNNIFILARRMPDPEDPSVSIMAKIFFIDQAKWSIKQITPSNVKWIEEMFLFGNKLYCSTENSLLIWKNNQWVVTKEKVNCSIPSEDLPSRKLVYNLKGGKRIEFSSTGIMIYY